MIPMTRYTRLLTHRALTTIAIVIAILFTQAVSAQNEGRWYQVEVLIFKRTAVAPVSDELWRKNLELFYPSDSQYLPDTLPKNTHQLGGHNYTLRRDEGYQVLFHKAWKQQMWGAEQSPSLIIRGGQSFGDHRELEGTLKIHIGRYLHVTTDLWLSDFTLKDTSNNNAPYQLPSLPGAEASNFFTEDVGASSVVTFRQKRRMRSKETHYIDHPLMGMLVRMLPLKQ